jgi:putative endonuclease
MPSFWSKFGSSAEAAALSWLESSQFRILDRNWRRPWGELDIVALKAGVIHFVEVKASVQRRAGFEPFVRAGATKMLKVQRTARTWLAAHNYNDSTEWQIDVISVIMNNNEPEFEYFENI